MSLRVLLADADGTLFDFHRGEAVAIGETFRRFGIPDTPGNLEIYSRVNHAQWLRLERGRNHAGTPACGPVYGFPARNRP